MKEKRKRETEEFTVCALIQGCQTHAHHTKHETQQSTIPGTTLYADLKTDETTRYILLN